jgi:hypothetical protein
LEKNEWNSKFLRLERTKNKKNVWGALEKTLRGFRVVGILHQATLNLSLDSSPFSSRLRFNKCKTLPHLKVNQYLY